MHKIELETILAKKKKVQVRCQVPEKLGELLKAVGNGNLSLGASLILEANEQSIEEFLKSKKKKTSRG